METTVYVHAPKSQVRSILRGIPREARQGGPADEILKRVGIVVLNKIAHAFAIKSQGGTDETGERWAELSPSTIAKRRRRANPTKTQDRPSSNLSDSQRNQWWSYYRRALAVHKDRATAAKIAWVLTKRKGGIGHYDKYAFEPILRDTNALYESFFPDARYNIFRIMPGEAELGTSRPAAGAHHSGAINLSQRRLWPHPSRWTSMWWHEMLEEASAGVIQLIIEKLK